MKSGVLEQSFRLPTLSWAGWRGAASFISPLAFLALWAWSAEMKFFPEQLVPSPATVWETFHELHDSGELQANLYISLYRLLTGFLTGACSGIVFGVALALSETVRVYFGPLFQALRQIPTLALIPMFILIFGIDETLKIVILIKATFFPVAIATLDGVRGIPRGWLEVGRIYRLPPLVLFRRIVFPATVPPVLTGVRIALGRAWLVLVAVELLAADSGIGQMMQMGRQMLRLDVVMVGVILTGLIGFALDKGFRLIERFLLRWRYLGAP